MRRGWNENRDGKAWGNMRQAKNMRGLGKEIERDLKRRTTTGEGSS